MSGLMVIAYAVSIMIVMIHAGSPTEFEWYLSTLPFWLWAIGPMFLSVFFICKLKLATIKAIFISLQAIIFALSLFIYYDAFYVHTDALNGIIFILLPIAEYILLLVVGLTAMIYEKIGMVH